MQKHWILMAALAVGCSGDSKDGSSKTGADAAQAKNVKKMKPLTKAELQKLSKKSLLKNVRKTAKPLIVAVMRLGWYHHQQRCKPHCLKPGFNKTVAKRHVM